MKLIKNLFYSSIYQIMAIIIPLITAPYVARVLGAENLGIFSYVNSVSQLCATIGLLGLANYSCREIAFSRDNKKTISKTFFELFFLRIILLFVTLIIYFFICFFDLKEIRIFYLYQSIWLCSSFLDISWFFYGIEEIKITVIKNMIVKIVSIILIFVMIKSDTDLGKYFLINGFSQLLGFISFIPNLKGKIVVKRYQLNLKRHLAPSLRIFLPQLAGILYLQMDKIMLNHLTDSSKYVSFYDQAEKIVKIPLAAITAFSSVMLPRVANTFKNTKNKIGIYINFSIRISMIIAFPMAFGIFAIANDFIPWFLGKEFLECINLMKVLSPIIVFIALSSVSSNQYFIVVDKTGILTLSYIVSAIINLFLNYIFIPKVGAYGAALGTVCAEFMAFALQYYYMCKNIKMKSIYRYIIRYFLFSSIMYAFILIFSLFLPSNIISTLIEVIIGIIVYLFLLYISKDNILSTLKGLDRI